TPAWPFPSLRWDGSPEPSWWPGASFSRVLVSKPRARAISEGRDACGASGPDRWLDPVGRSRLHTRQGDPVHDRSHRHYATVPPDPGWASTFPTLAPVGSGAVGGPSGPGHLDGQ